MNDTFDGHKIFFPQYKKGRLGLQIFPGTILDHAKKLGVPVASECGGKGVCGRCLVRIEKGAEALNELTAVERGFELGPNGRLACQARIERPADLQVFVRNVGTYSILSESIDREVALAPFVREDDGKVVWDGPDGPRNLGPYEDALYGLAIDVGTTTLVCQLLDLETGEQIATIAGKNPQAAYGEDVISRIDHVLRHDDGLRELQQVVMRALNEMIAQACRDYRVQSAHIYEAVAVGNPTMRNIFFAQDVRSLGLIPFEPPSLDALNVPAEDLGLAINPRANVYGPRLIGGHAGADCLADIMACGMYESENVQLMLDVGTNGEVAIGNRDKIMTASCAAGGAYEGATVKGGVGALEGAINNVRIEDGQAQFSTIGDKPPIGICGSGLIDLLSELLRTGIMTDKAKLAEEFVLTDGIGLSQQDVYQLITAKAGLRTDQDLLIDYYGITLDDVETIFMAGGFANFINPESAVRIGLFPDAADKMKRMGNGALAGARDMLISRDIREKSEDIARSIEHTKPNELEPEFAYIVAENMYF